GIELLGPVGRADHQHGLPLGEAVHLHQELVQRPIVLAVPPMRPAAGAERVDLVDEDHPAPLARLPEQRLDPRYAEPHQKSGDLGAGDGEEGDPGLAGHRPRHQGLAGSRRAVHQHALRTRAPTRSNFSGYLRNSTISRSSATAPSLPATFANVVVETASWPSVAAAPPPPSARLTRNPSATNPTSTTIRLSAAIPSRRPPSTNATLVPVPSARRSTSSSAVEGYTTRNRSPSAPPARHRPRISRPGSISSEATRPAPSASSRVEYASGAGRGPPRLASAIPPVARRIAAASAVQHIQRGSARGRTRVCLGAGMDGLPWLAGVARAGA